MSKRRKRQGKSAKSTKKDTLPSETRAAEIVTIAWMLSVMVTLMGELASIAAWVFGRTYQGLVFLAIFLFFTSLVTGVFSLVMAFVALRVRQTPPPKGIIVFSLVVGGTPLAYLLLNWIG